MVYTDPPFILFTRTWYIHTQHNTDYLVIVLNYYSAIPAADESPTPGHSNYMIYNLITFNVIFSSSKNTIPSYSIYKILGVFLLRGVNSLPCAVLLQSQVPVKVALKYPVYYSSKEYNLSKVTINFFSASKATPYSVINVDYLPHFWYGALHLCDKISDKILLYCI